jgi:hypothetical protein
MNKNKIMDDNILRKVKDGGPMPEQQLGRSRGWVKKILRMTNDEILEENRKILAKTSGLSTNERKFCAQMALFITDYHMESKGKKNG